MVRKSCTSVTKASTMVRIPTSPWGHLRTQSEWEEFLYAIGFRKPNMDLQALITSTMPSTASMRPTVPASHTWSGWAVRACQEEPRYLTVPVLPLEA